jgi:helix-turn-helix protein/uncharacterized protein DUF4115
MFQIGPSLREARERRGLSSADVQKAIRIRARYLSALEDERWELLPGDAYVKGFLRTYADFLGLDGNLYVEEYNSRFAHHDDQLLVPPALARRSAGAGVAVLRPLVVLGAIAAVVASIVAWQLHGRGGAQQGGDTTTRQTTTGTTTSAHRSHRTHPPAAALPSHAVLAATRGPCWLEIREGSPSGALVYEGVLQQGQTRTVSLAHGEVWMDVGDPPNLDVRLAGKIVPGLPTQAGTVLLSRRGLS